MISFPNAKINLGLYIERRRPDGYHDISTVFYPVPLTDAVEIIPARHTSLHTYGNRVDCPPEKNLVMKAYRMMAEEFSLPEAEIHLYKHIPDGAGLGGGSSDATAVIRLLNTMFSLGLDDAQLAARAAKLGADCPFFVYNRPMAARGIGNEFSPVGLNLSGMTIVIVKPDVSVPTAAAYAGVTPRMPSEPVEKTILRRPEEWRDTLANDFEASVFPVHPELADLKQSFYNAGAVYASMSGSGSAIFGLFDNDNMADSFIAECRYSRIYKHIL